MHNDIKGQICKLFKYVIFNFKFKVKIYSLVICT